jgi:hypothetical protein
MYKQRSLYAIAFPMSVPSRVQSYYIIMHRTAAVQYREVHRPIGYISVYYIYYLLYGSVGPLRPRPAETVYPAWRV